MGNFIRLNNSYKPSDSISQLYLIKPPSEEECEKSTYGLNTGFYYLAIHFKDSNEPWVLRLGHEVHGVVRYHNIVERIISDINGNSFVIDLSKYYNSKIQ